MRKRIYTLLALIPGFFPAMAWAADTAASTCDTPKKGGGLMEGVTDACAGCGQCQLPDILVVANVIIKIILGLTGSISLLMVIVGGAFYLFSGGEQENIKKGTNILKGALWGIIIVFGAYTIVEVVMVLLGVPNAPEILKMPFGKK